MVEYRALIIEVTRTYPYNLFTLAKDIGGKLNPMDTLSIYES